MKEFIPLEDDWSLVEAFFAQRLVPYQPGMPCAHQAMAVPACERQAGRASEKKFFDPPSQPSSAAL